MVELRGEKSETKGFYMESSDSMKRSIDKQGDTIANRQERRKENRYPVDEELIAFLNKVPCRVLDVSRSGMGLASIMNDPLASHDTTLDILLAEEKVFISDIPCRVVNSTISSISTELSLLTSRRLGILFDDLDEDIRSQLDSILRRYVAGSA